MGSPSFKLAASDFWSSIRHAVTGALGGAVLGVAHAYQAANGQVTKQALISAGIGGVVAWAGRLAERTLRDTTDK